MDGLAAQSRGFLDVAVSVNRYQTLEGECRCGQILDVITYGVHCIFARKNYLRIKSLVCGRFASKLTSREVEAVSQSRESDRWLRFESWLRMITKSSAR